MCLRVSASALALRVVVLSIKVELIGKQVLIRIDNIKVACNHCHF